MYFENTMELMFDTYSSENRSFEKVLEKTNIKGLWQYCILSSKRFSIIIDWIINELGINWGALKTLESLEFTDDICLLISSKESMQHKTDKK